MDLVPFSEVTKNLADVNVSQDGATATTFTFDSPVYLEDGKEYCVVLLSNSNEYEAFISRMGESDLITGETISGQPYANFHCSYLRTHQHGLNKQTILNSI